MVKINLYFINWNDSFYFPFIKKHYGKFCHKIIMYDNHSTDNSVEIAEGLGFEVRTFGNPNELDDHEYLIIKNNCWKEARGKADFVIVCDADEFLYHENLNLLLNRYKLKKISIPSTQGYEVVSESLPVQDIFECKTGFKNKKFSKSIIFNPHLIEEINYNYGCHNHKARGTINKSWTKLGVYHYRMIGGVDRWINRHQEYRNKLSQFNIEKKFGKEYMLDVNIKKQQWIDSTSKSRLVIK